MASENAKLTIVSVDNFSQTFGSTDYAVLTASTESNDIINVAITHNALRSRGINIELLDSIVGSTLIATQNTDIQTGLVTSGKERVQGLVDGTLMNPNTNKPATILLFNRSNCSLIKSELYMSDTKDLASLTQAKVQIEEKKERKRENARRVAERMKDKSSSQTVAQKEPSLETNDDETPF